MFENGLPFGFNDEGVFIDEEMSNIEKILHSKKLNYEDLKKISDPLFNDNNCEVINLFIDVYDIFKALYSPMIQEEFNSVRTSGRMTIIIELINIIGHYRHFFASRYQKYTTVIFYYSSKKDKYLTSINEDYKKSFYSKRLKGEDPQFNIINEVLQDCISVIKEYINFVPHAFFIDSGELEPRLVPYTIIEDEKIDLKERIYQEDFNIIMSNDDLALTNLLTMKNTIIFKNYGRGKSYYVKKTEILKEIGIEDNTGCPLTPSVLLALAMSGNKHYGIKNLKGYGYKKSFNKIVKAFKDGKNIFEYNENLFPDLDWNLIENNLKQINPEIYPLTNSKRISIENQIFDTPNYDYIYRINLDYFNGKYTESYVIFDYLFEGE